MMGLLTPTQITANTNNTPFPMVENAGGANRGAYQLLNNPSGVDWDWGSPGAGEYFLLENRQQFGYDSALPGAGLCIWHISEGVAGDNTANSTEGSSAPGNPRLVVMEQMDGTFDLEGFGGTNPNGANNGGDTTDPWAFPNEFDDKSTPNTRLYSGSSTWVGVIDISASATTMTADIQFGPPATAAAFRVERTGNVLADQTFYGASFQVGSADVAEWVNVTELVEPGDLLEFDPVEPGRCRKARGGCSALVAGVVSSDPGFLLGEFVSGERAPLALIGIVPVKACDEGGPIRPGDLLIPAGIPGRIRRWTPADADCPLVGKALSPLRDREGLILVLLIR